MRGTGLGYPCFRPRAGAVPATAPPRARLQPRPVRAGARTAEWEERELDANARGAAEGTPPDPGAPPGALAGGRPLVDPPAGVLPPPRRAALPAPVPLRSMIGPGVILAGLSIGSGEFVLWPRITAEYGLVLFWGCVAGVTFQFFLNMEIERYTLATGESAVTGFVRLGAGFAPLFLVLGLLPWIWPGWASGAGTLLAMEVGGDPTALAVAGLVACGAILTLSPVVYRSVEWLQFALVGSIFTLAVWLAFELVDAEALRALAVGALRFGRVPEGIDLPLLLGALAFAGAGGTVNLAQSNYVKDKGYGMGGLVGRLTSPFTGRAEPASEVGFVFHGTAEEVERFRVWWWRANVEHALSFFLLCLLSLALFCLFAWELLPRGGPVPEGFGFLAAEATALEARFGAAGRHLFLWAGVAVLLSTELALLDAVSRVAADLLRAGPLRGRAGPGLPVLYAMVVWGLVLFGAVVLAAGFQEPLLLLITSAALNGGVMFLYGGLLLWLNLRTFRGPLRPSPLRRLALGLAVALYGVVAVVTLVDRIAAWLGDGAAA